MDKKYAEFCKNRRERLSGILQENKIAAIILEDTEGKRDTSIRYLTGHPGDALLIITAKGESVLCPWDENMAKQMAVVDKIIPLTKFSRNPIACVKAVLQQLDIKTDSKIEISPATPYPEFLKYVDALAGYNVLCRENSVHNAIISMRAIKDEYEIDCIRTASKIADDLLDKIEQQIRSGQIKTESDVALLIEKECRNAGCEGTGFETLVANPSRSFGIHCFPAYTGKDFPCEGLSIIDFGVKYNGYTSDITVTFASGNLSEGQEKQLELVQKAYDSALELYKNGVPIKSPAVKVDSIFAKAKKHMPHSLGHGIGLEAHEYPVIKASVACENVFLPGMIVTLEPGLYDAETGGCRLENDVLITENGNEVLTHSRIIRL